MVFKMNLNQAIEQAKFLDLQGTNGLADFIRQQQAEIQALKEKLMMEEESYMLLDEESLVLKNQLNNNKLK
jgi:hypothetical protein